MAEMPMDIIMKHVNAILNAKWLPDGAPDAVELASNLNCELRDKFHISALEPMPKPPEGTQEATIRLTGNPMLWYFGTDLVARRLDDGPVFGSTLPSGREAQIALALTDISASRLRDVTK